MRGNDCNADHRMLRAKVVVGRNTGKGVKRWDVAKLWCTSEDARERGAVRKVYLTCFGAKVQEFWNV